MWIVSISINLYRMIVLLVRNTYSELKIHHWFVWSASLFLSFLPMTTGSYGPAGQWCWISAATKFGVVWRYTTLYGPLIFFFTLIIVIYIFIGRALYRDRLTTNPTGRQSSKKKVIFKLILYPVVMIICYTPALINRWDQLAHGLQINWHMTLAHIIARAIYPVLCAVIYLAPLISKYIIKPLKIRWNNHFEIINT